MFALSPSLFLSLRYDLLASDLINKGLIWGKGRVRGLCVCVSLCLCVHDPDGAPSIVRLREGETSREGTYGPPIFRHLRFPSIDCCSYPRSHVLSCVYVCMHCLYLLSILFMAACRWRGQSLILISVSPSLKSLPGCVCLLSLHPPIQFLHPPFLPLSVSGLSSFYSVPPSAFLSSSGQVRGR